MSYYILESKVSIFGSKVPKRKRRSNRGTAKKQKISEKEKDAIGREKLMRLHHVAFSLLALKSQEERPNKWVSDTFDLVNNNPSRLSDKWIDRINSWTEELIKGMSLDEPDVAEGDRVPLGPFKIFKIIPPKYESEYPMPAIIAIDERGWKWYFKTSKANNFAEGNMITFVATISSHKDGITFVKRASKIICADDAVDTTASSVSIFD